MEYTVTMKLRLSLIGDSVAEVDSDALEYCQGLMCVMESEVLDIGQPGRLRRAGPVAWRTWSVEHGSMIGCPRTGPRHPIEGWCPGCPRVIMSRRVKRYEIKRGYAYPGAHNMTAACRINLDGLGNVYESDHGCAFCVDGCEHVAFVGALP